MYLELGNYCCEKIGCALKTGFEITSFITFFMLLQNPRFWQLQTRFGSSISCDNCIIDLSLVSGDIFWVVGYDQKNIT